MQFEEPLFHIHYLNVDYPNLTGILYFPKLGSDLQMKDKIQLYQNQVYVTDNEELYLNF
jgi:molecular chaperone HtpG